MTDKTMLVICTAAEVICLTTLAVKAFKAECERHKAVIDLIDSEYEKAVLSIECKYKDLEIESLKEQLENYEKKDEGSE